MGSHQSSDCTSPLVELARGTGGVISEQLREVLSRKALGHWAAHALKRTPQACFRFGPLGELLEYVLGRSIDDDWTPPDEYAAEMEDLVARLEDGLRGELRLP